MQDTQTSSPSRDDIACAAMFGAWIVCMFYVPDIAAFLAAILK